MERDLTVFYPIVCANLQFVHKKLHNMFVCACVWGGGMGEFCASVCLNKSKFGALDEQSYNDDYMHHLD